MSRRVRGSSRKVQGVNLTPQTKYKQTQLVLTDSSPSKPAHKWKTKKLLDERIKYRFNTTRTVVKNENQSRLKGFNEKKKALGVNVQSKAFQSEVNLELKRRIDRMEELGNNPPSGIDQHTIDYLKIRVPKIRKSIDKAGEYPVLAKNKKFRRKADFENEITLRTRFEAENIEKELVLERTKNWETYHPKYVRRGNIQQTAKDRELESASNLFNRQDYAWSYDIMLHEETKLRITPKKEQSPELIENYQKQIEERMNDRIEFVQTDFVNSGLLLLKEENKQKLARINKTEKRVLKLGEEEKKDFIEKKDTAIIHRLESNVYDLEQAKDLREFKEKSDEVMKDKLSKKEIQWDRNELSDLLLDRNPQSFEIWKYNPKAVDIEKIDTPERHYRHLVESPEGKYTMIEARRDLKALGINPELLKKSHQKTITFDSEYLGSLDRKNKEDNWDELRDIINHGIRHKYIGVRHQKRYTAEQRKQQRYELKIKYNEAISKYRELSQKESMMDTRISKANPKTKKLQNLVESKKNLTKRRQKAEKHMFEIGNKLEEL